MLNDQVKNTAFKLRLGGVLRGFEARTQQATADNLTPMEFLKFLLEDEMQFRKELSAKKLLTQAKFRHDAALEEWDMSFDRGITKAKVRELASLGFYQQNENLIVLGRTGEGKTHFAISLGRRLCQDNSSVIFMPMSYLFEEIIAAKSAGKYMAFVRKISKARVLILDDFGLRNYTHDEATALVDILEDRHRKGSVIITSQVDPKGWIKLFEDPVIAEAIVDRIINPSQKITLQGGSYREKLKSKLPTSKNVELKDQTM